MPGNDAWNLYAECHNALRAVEGVTTDYQANYTKSHYYTPTPRTEVWLNDIYLGYIMHDKDQCSPARYFSYYTGVTGGQGFYGQPAAETVVRIFKLQYALRAKTLSQEDALTEGRALGIRDAAVLYYFGS
jgi:hypothetical protein